MGYKKALMAHGFHARLLFSCSGMPIATKLVMKVEGVLPMVAGTGETSYAANSSIQGKVISMNKPIVEAALREIYTSTLLTAERMAVVDLGCSSGPNVFLLVSLAIDAVGDVCRSLGRRPPELQFFLNDLPDNDFNSVFRSLEWYEKKLEEEEENGDEIVPHYIVGSPGSFYGRLFPCKSVHFFHSSFSLHWLSKVPQGLVSKSGVQLNEGNIYIGNTSPPCVLELYQKQFKKDLSLFLHLRSKEIVPGGQMVLTMLGRKDLLVLNEGVGCIWQLVAEALISMASEGLVEKDNLDSFNLPFYAPSIEEVEEVIQQTGWFDISRSQILEINVDPHDDSNDDFVRDNIQSGENVTKSIRAVMQPIFESQFGEEILDELFSRLETNIARQFLKEKMKYTILVFALRVKP